MSWRLKKQKNGDRPQPQFKQFSLWVKNIWRAVKKKLQEPDFK